MKLELVVLPTVLQCGLMGMTFGALLRSLGPKNARTASFGLLLGLMQTDMRRTIGST